MRNFPCSREKERTIPIAPPEAEKNNFPCSPGEKRTIPNTPTQKKRGCRISKMRQPCYSQIDIPPCWALAPAVYLPTTFRIGQAARSARIISRPFSEASSPSTSA